MTYLARFRFATRRRPCGCFDPALPPGGQPPPGLIRAAALAVFVNRTALGLPSSPDGLNCQKRPPCLFQFGFAYLRCAALCSEDASVMGAEFPL